MITLLVLPQGGQDQTDPKMLADLKLADTEAFHRTFLSGLTTHAMGC